MRKVQTLIDFGNLLPVRFARLDTWQKSGFRGTSSSRNNSDWKQKWRIMRLIVFFLFLACLQVSAKDYGQNVTIRARALPLEKVFKQIEKQTGISILYSTEVLQKAHPVTIDLHNVPINEALNKCMENQPLIWEPDGNTIIIKPAATLPDKNKIHVNKTDTLETLIPYPLKNISGHVTDSAGKPLVGVTVNIKGTKTAAATDENGNFSFSNINPDKVVLVFNYIGYETQTISLKGETQITVVMKQTVNELSEMTINTGYQKLKPNEVNGSYEVIDNKLLNRQTGLNILDRLNGITSSLLVNLGKQNPNPQNKTGITIRGYSTINGPLDPLIVVDNFIYNGDINNINPNDVESITVLKDAAATSIWGARAGNGVIVITTKKGKFNQKTQIDFNSDIILTQKPDLFYNAQISPADYIDFEQMLFAQGYFDAQLQNRTHPALSPAVIVFDNKRKGLISAADSMQEINALKSNDNRRQFADYFYRRGITQQYALNLRGGGPNIAWLVSGDYDKDIGNLRSDYNKINLRFENTYRPFKNMTVNAGVYYTNSTSLSGMPDYKTLVTLNGNRQVPYLPLAGPGGSSIPLPRNYDLRYMDTLGGGNLLDWNYYPLTDYLHSRAKNNIEELLAHVGVEYKIIDGLDINLLYQYQRQNTDGTTLFDTASSTARQTVNRFSQLNRSTGTITYIVPPGGIMNKSYASLNSYNFRGQLNFDKRIGSKHHINAIAGTEVRNEWASSNSTIYYGYSDDPLNYATGMDFKNYYPDLLSGSYSSVPPASGGITATDNRFVSVFANASYSYNEKYTVSGSMRKDGSNIFGANTNDKWKPLWSGGVGWEISKEKFYHINRLSFLKLYATYGVSGNVDLSKTALPVAIANTSYHTGLPYEDITVLNNPDLSWEKSYQLNFKLAFALSGNVLTGSVEYYRKRGIDLYAPTEYDYTAWGLNKTITANAADMKGKGIDIELHSRNLRGSLEWNTDFIFNYNTAVTAKYYGSTPTSLNLLIGNAGSIITPIVGKPLYAIAAYRWGGLDRNGNPRGYLNDTLSTDYNAIEQASLNEGLASGSFKYIGSANPVVYGSVMNSFSFKGLSLSFNIMYKLGYYLLKPSLGYYALATAGTNGIGYDKRWQQPGDETKTDIPSFVYPLSSARDALYGASTANIIRGDNIRLQFVNLAYRIKLHKVHSVFNGAELYLNAANIGILWRANKYGIDPDYVNSIPPPKIYTLGLRFNF